MGHDQLVTVFGVLTTLLALGYGVPQLLKVRRDGDVSGVSIASNACALVSATAWVLYAVWIGDVWVLLTSAAAAPGLIAALVVLVRHHASREGMSAVLWWAGSLLVAAAVVPLTQAPLVLLLGCSVLWYVAPAVWTAYRSADVSGVARGAWWLLLVEAGVCTVYGIAADVPPYLVYAAISAIGSVLMLARTSGASRTAPACATCGGAQPCACVPAPV